ncbi:MAG TPA: DUF1326 domain-containing protein [Gaiellaceae bacterium]|nr:DUF1326 domain-containing protein [Gaiellaceae bacterium]
MAESWTMKGTVLIACNCAYGCPCNFNALPTTGKCEGEWTWHVEEGAYGTVDLRSVTFTLAVNWPGAIHEGNGVALLLVDERTTPAQRDAIHTLVKGEAGGPWGVLGWTWPTLHGPEAVSFELELDGLRSRVRAGAGFELELEPIRNPVSGAEVTPGAVLPQGIVFKQGDFASTRRYRVEALGIDYRDTYAAVAPFDYAGGK